MKVERYRREGGAGLRWGVKRVEALAKEKGGNEASHS